MVYTISVSKGALTVHLRRHDNSYATGVKARSSCSSHHLQNGGPVKVTETSTVIVSPCFLPGSETTKQHTDTHRNSHVLDGGYQLTTRLLG